ncbi:endoribonuclease MazF [uncultured Campylobacter sp.]|uniref:endoribonuclease MazF n=1 Tax=uncultured Campylobacter sp. TaxID=218934 RepID=UPI0026362019|nr:endoribonuclease MazF [uncultured Campylobacter sp.]
MNYIPDTGDVAWIDFNPQAGHEQAKRRPAVVLTPKAYNEKTGLLICVPLSTKIKGYPFEISIKGEKESIALSDQVKSLDWNARRAEYKAKVSQNELEEIKIKLALLIGIS